MENEQDLPDTYQYPAYDYESRLVRNAIIGQDELISLQRNCWLYLDDVHEETSYTNTFNDLIREIQCSYAYDRMGLDPYTYDLGDILYLFCFFHKGWWAQKDHGLANDNNALNSLLDLPNTKETFDAEERASRATKRYLSSNKMPKVISLFSFMAHPRGFSATFIPPD